MHIYIHSHIGQSHVVRQIRAFPLPTLVIVHDIAQYFGGDIKITSTPLSKANCDVYNAMSMT